jgi:hypothetical protein
VAIEARSSLRGTRGLAKSALISDANKIDVAAGS